jgi:hypothetical protein
MEDLSCPECKKPFSLSQRVPKTLQCLHTFCVKCLKLEYTEEGKPFVLCPAPLCGTRHYLDPGKNLENGLKTDYFIERASSRYQKLTSDDPHCTKCSAADNQAVDYCETCKILLCQACSGSHGRADDTKDDCVKEIKALLREVQSSGKHDTIAPFTTEENWKCEGHPKRDRNVGEVSLYCLTCSKMICIQCALSGHAGHDKKGAAKVLEEEEGFQIEEHLEELRCIRDDYARAVDITDEEINQLDRAQRDAVDEVVKAADGLQKELTAERDALMTKVGRIHDVRVAEIEVELEKLEKSRGEMTHSIEFVKSALLCLPEDILDQEQALVDRLEQLCREFEEHPLEPSQRDVFVLTPNEVNLENAIGSVYTNPDYSSLVKGIEEVPFQQGMKAEFDLTCCDSIGNILPATDFEVVLVEVRPDAEIFPVRRSENGTYAVALEPHSSGEHLIQLAVQKEGETVPLAPVTVFVSPALREEAEIVKEIKCDDIQGMICPAAVAVSGQQRVAIADGEAHKVFVVTLDGEIMSVVGRKGEEKGELNSPQGIAWWGEDLVVADTGNNRVQVWSGRGGFCNQLGKLGGFAGEFMMPTGVAVSVSEDITTLYVADSVNNRIQFFKMTDIREDGELMGVFKLQNRPLSLCVGDHGRIFVTESLANKFEVLSHPRREGEPQEGEQGTPEPRPKHLPELKPFRSCTHKQRVDQLLVRVQGIAYDSQTRHVLVTEEGTPYISVYLCDGSYVGSVKLPKEDMHLPTIAALNSRVVAFDTVNRSIFVLGL